MPRTRRLLPLVLCLAGLVAPAARADEDAAALVERSRVEIRIEPEQSRRLAEQALGLLQRRPDADTELRARVQLCDYHSERNREAALEQARLAAELVPRLRRPGLRAAVALCEGEVREYAGEIAQAMALYDQAAQSAVAAGDDEMQAEALHRRGYLRGVRGELATGLSDLRRALALFERLKLPLQAQDATNAIAILYNRMGDWQQARRFYELSLKTQLAEGLRREAVVTSHNLGRALENLGEWEGARQAFEQVRQLAHEIDYPRGEAYGLRGLASVRNAFGAPQEALRLLDEAQALQRGTPDERLRAQILLQRGIALRSLQRPAEAIPALQQALAVFTRAESLGERQASHGELARTFALLGDWRAAYEQQRHFTALSEQLLRRQLDERFASLKVEYDSVAKDTENQLLQRENEATERALAQERRAGELQAIALALGAVLAAVLGVLLWRHRRANAAMRHLAMTDELTGLPNRRHVLAQLALQLRRQAPVALLIADLDHFKHINDEHGHLVGDEVLRAVAELLRDFGRDPVSLGRLGGEEFVVVLPDTDLDGALHASERLRELVASLDVRRWLGEERLTVSVGAAAAHPGDGVGDMLRRADEGLYAAKAAGRNRVMAAPARPSAAPSLSLVQPGRPGPSALSS